MENELPVTGYLDRFSHRPGERFSARVSVRDGGACEVRLLRVVCGDPNPAGPGMRLDDLSAVFSTRFDGARQPVPIGSYGIAESLPAVAGAMTWTALIWTAAPHKDGTILSQTDGTHAVAIGLAGGEAVARIGTLRLVAKGPLTPRRWYRLTLAADPAGHATLAVTPLDQEPPRRAEAHGPIALPAGGTLMLAAENPSQPTAHYTGKIEAPRVAPGFHPDDAPAAPALAAWDFSDGIGTQIATDRGPHGRHARLINLPARGMVGSTWSGREMSWRHAPDEYAAIAFHADDIEDCHWAESFGWTVPADLRSGAYAFHLRCANGEDWLPFYVLPPKGTATAKLAFLASTFTYQAYANHARDNADAAWHARANEWGGYPHNPDQFPIYGRSTYNRHPDGAGISISSRARPILTMRPGFSTFHEPVAGKNYGNAPPGSGMRHYPADTHLLAWLDAKGIEFDIITDEDLDDEGPALIAPYRAVLTGSHPEYHTPGTLNALQHYVDHGGRLAYLGGNGFYWRIARVKELPHIIELRRGEGGIRAWDAEAGEYYHQLDGGYGGLWRRNRRPPQMLAGVGFSGQGKFEGTHYRRLAPSYEPRFAWMFAGIDEDTLGDYGLSGGGAAGFELDRADFALGTPPQTVILARSENPPESFVTVPEELLSHIATVTGEPPDQLMRGEIIWFDTPSGGAVFAVGSITFCGSLWHPGLGAFAGPISQLLENVVGKFLEEA